MAHDVAMLGTVSRRGPGALRWPLLAAVAAAAGIGYVAAVDPNAAGHYPDCPLLVVTGWFCPGCGGLRAVHALARGDMATALSRNVLVVALVPVLAVLWIRWAHRSWIGAPRPGPVPASYVWGLAVVVIVFAVVRNLPVATALAP
ncbi:MAG: DUF2752 domain-containing protein [Ilumatobacteraceae bacterium]